MAELDGVQISEEFVVEKSQPIADPEVVFEQRHLPSGSVSGDREFGSAGFLSVEKATDGFDGLKLVIEVGLEVEFHGFRLQAADRFEAVLVEDRRQVGLGHVIGERAVAEDHGALAQLGLALCATRLSPRARGSASPCVMEPARQTRRTPPPMLWMALPAMVR